jgi:hypothetical protein
VEDEVRIRCLQAEERRPLEAKERHLWVKNRTIQAEPVELTSRESTSSIAGAKGRLALPFSQGRTVDVALASNMISVGVDIDRLGLMVVAGQPKTASEYIQASSRVGRQWPGLVLTCLNTHKPRDRSHYERFIAFHGSFYRDVETTSVTPFSGPALDRGFVGTLFAMARLGHMELTHPAAVMKMKDNRSYGEEAVRAIAERGRRQPLFGVTAAEDQEQLYQSLLARGQSLLDSWQGLMETMKKEAGAKRCYSPFDVETEGHSLLRVLRGQTAAQDVLQDEAAKFQAPTSMRDVEPTVDLWLKRMAPKSYARRDSDDE